MRLRLPAILFAASPLIVLGQAQTPIPDSPLPPRVATIPVPAPANQPFYAVVSMFANPSSLAFVYDEFTVQGNSIIAYFQSGCGILCPGQAFNSTFPLKLPALAAGTYQLKVVDAGDPSYVDAVLPLIVGFGAAPALVTYPSRPSANEPSDAEFRALAHSDVLGVYDGPRVSGSNIVFGFDDYYCFSTCSDEVTYRSFPVHFPALPEGTYDVRFEAGYVAQFVYGPPWLPPVAHFSLTVGAAPSTVPALTFRFLAVLGLGLIALGARGLRWHRL